MKNSYETLIEQLKLFISKGELKEVIIGKQEYSTFQYYVPDLPGMVFTTEYIFQTDEKGLIKIFQEFIKDKILTREQITNALIEASEEKIDYLFIYFSTYMEYIKNTKKEIEEGSVGVLNKKRDNIMDWEKLVHYVNNKYLDEGIPIKDELYLSNEGMRRFNKLGLETKFNI